MEKTTLFWLDSNAAPLELCNKWKVKSLALNDRATDLKLQIDDGRRDTGALQRGLAVLEVLIEAAMPMPLNDIGQAIGLSGGSLHRLLQDLVKMNYVVRASGRSYMASPKALAPLSLYHPVNQLRRDAHKRLQELREEFHLTSSIVVFVGYERLILEVAQINEMLSPYYDACLTSPLYAGASGKVMLMRLPADRITELVGSDPFMSRTSATITRRSRLDEELRLSRDRGFATAIDEDYEGVAAVAAPISIGEEQPVACFILSGESSRLRQIGVDRIGAALKAKADVFAFGSPSLRLVRNYFGRHAGRVSAVLGAA